MLNENLRLAPLSALLRWGETNMKSRHIQQIHSTTSDMRNSSALLVFLCPIDPSHCFYIAFTSDLVHRVY